MRCAFVSTALLALMLAGSQPAAAQAAPTSIVGVWKLTSFLRKEVGTDAAVQPYGEHPGGYRIHTRGGHAYYMFFHENRKPAAGSVTDADRVEWFKTMTAAGGTYEVDGNKVVFQAEVSSTPSSSGKPLTYRFEIAGKALTMTTDPVKSAAGGPDVFFVTTYERVE
jgi:hypothetical protein